MIELYSKMRGELLMPRTIVSYEREAFIFAPGNVRITLDRKVCTCTSSAVFLNTLSNFLEPEPGNTVLEVNTTRFCRTLSGWQYRCLTEKPVRFQNMLSAGVLADSSVNFRKP